MNSGRGERFEERTRVFSRKGKNFEHFSLLKQQDWSVPFSKKNKIIHLLKQTTDESLIIEFSSYVRVIDVT